LTRLLSTYHRIRLSLRARIQSTPVNSRCAREVAEKEKEAKTGSKKQIRSLFLHLSFSPSRTRADPFSCLPNIKIHGTRRCAADRQICNIHRRYVSLPKACVPAHMHTFTVIYDARRCPICSRGRELRVGPLRVFRRWRWRRVQTRAEFATGPATTDGGGGGGGSRYNGVHIFKI